MNEYTEERRPNALSYRALCAKIARGGAWPAALMGLPLAGVILLGKNPKTFLEFPPVTHSVEHAGFSRGAFIIAALLAEGFKIRAYDPEGIENFKRCADSRIAYASDAYAALSGADGLVIVTEWNEFKSPDLARMAELMRGKVIFDARNILKAGEVRGLGFEYFGVGVSR